MVNFIRDHKNWCRTCTPFEKELRRHFYWEEFEKELRRYFHLRRLNTFQHFDLRRHWEGFPFEKDLRSMELLQSSWDGFEKVRWIWEGNVPSRNFNWYNYIVIPGLVFSSFVSYFSQIFPHERNRHKLRAEQFCKTSIPKWKKITIYKKRVTLAYSTN